MPFANFLQIKGKGIKMSNCLINHKAEVDHFEKYSKEGILYNIGDICSGYHLPALRLLLSDGCSCDYYG